MHLEASRGTLGKKGENDGKSVLTSKRKVLNLFLWGCIFFRGAFSWDGLGTLNQNI